MKKCISFITTNLVTLLVLTNLEACGLSSKDSEIYSDPDTIESNDIVLDMTWLEKVSGSISDEEIQKAAFGEILWDAYQKGILPNGQKLDYIDKEFASGNSFAIMDVDGDGNDELLLCWENACAGGMITYVFGYDNKKVYVELAEFPTLTFYDNGVVDASWPFDRGLGGEIWWWPYTVYCYDAKNDVYQFFGGVDAWDKSYREQNFDGETFPANIDTDGDGVIYAILSSDEWDGQGDISGDVYTLGTLVDGAEYENWQNRNLDGAEVIDISWQKLTEENMTAVIKNPLSKVISQSSPPFLNSSKNAAV